MRIIFTGGGTGGHTVPNIAIIDQVRASSWAKQCEMHYIGTKNSIEEKLVSALKIPFHSISAGKLRRYFSLQNIADIFKVGKGYIDALLILRRLQPDLVFAKGGYVSLPVVAAARTLRIPVWIHESDVSPGLATKL